MNEARAIEFASDNRITVSTDSRKRIKVGGKWDWLTEFKVGAHMVTRQGDSRDWQVFDKTGAMFQGRRGACIAFCVQAELNDRSDQS